MKFVPYKKTIGDLLPHENAAVRHHPRSRQQPPQDTESSGIWDFSVSRTMRNKFLLF
jgi:hypothetical protein